jgi:hypothetical protein
MRRFSMLVVLLLALAAPSSVQAQGGGVLTGTVVNGTAGGSEIGAGLTVTLYVIQGSTELQTLETTTDDEGRFRFEGLDTDPELDYWLEAVYQEVPTSGEEAYSFVLGQTEIEATLTVYETTTDDDEIRIGSVHIIAESFGQVLRLSEIHFFGNEGDRAYVGSPGEDGRRRTIFIPLPEGATGVASGDDPMTDRYVEADGGLWDTEPVPPGAETSLAFFSYHLIVGGDTVPLEHEFAYPVGDLNLLVAQPGLTLRSDQLMLRGPESFQGREYDVYAALGLGPDAPLVLEFVPLEEDEALAGSMGGTEEGVAGISAGGSQETLRTIGFVLAFLAVGGVLAYSFTTRGRGRRRGGPAERATAERGADPHARRLLVELADLQDALEAGQVEEGEYERRRAQIYESLQSS